MGWTRHPLLVGVISALIAGAATFGATVYAVSNGQTVLGLVGPVPSATPTVTATTTTTATVTATPSTTSESGRSLYLSDVPRDNFVKSASNPTRGAVSINGLDYPNSYSYRFTNCSKCTVDDQIQVSPSYNHLEGTFGLTDESRHDDVIDGVVYVSILDNSGVIYGPERVEYPEKVDFNLDIATSRLTFRVTDGTNSEFAAWADVILSAK